MTDLKAQLSISARSRFSFSGITSTLLNGSRDILVRLSDQGGARHKDTALAFID